MSAAAPNQKMFCAGGWRIFVVSRRSLVVSAASLRADDLATGFEAANKLYAEGKFAEAVFGL